MKLYVSSRLVSSKMNKEKNVLTKRPPNLFTLSHIFHDIPSKLNINRQNVFFWESISVFCAFVKSG